MKTGRVYLVGAGPGDPGLMTTRGLECLAQADVVIYDHLVDERLLSSVPGEAEIIYAGKTAGQHAKTQSEINQLLLQKAKAGKTVVRLKGGDPFVFGRGGEEAEALQKDGIPVTVVPGVSSAIAVPAYAGIPVTHRGLASSFAVITGHEDPEKSSSSINWAKLATGVDTLVFLMGVQSLPQIVNRLLEHGRPPDTPIAVIQDGTRPEQKAAVGSLSDIIDKARKQRLTAPAVVVVGQVVNLREKLRWFDNRPLFGKRILVTRARRQASGLSKLLAERGAQPIELPAIEIQEISNMEALDGAISNIKRYHWAIFTSTNGVEAFFRRLHHLKLDSRAVNGLKIGAIGPATAIALEERGITPDYVPEAYTSRGLLAGLSSRGVGGQRFLLPRADIADKELTEGLSKLGAEADDIAVYRTIPAVSTISQARQMLLSGEIEVITFTSSSTVANLVAAFDGQPPAMDGTRIACIGAKTADTAARAGLRVDIVAEESTITGLVAAIEQYFSKES